MINQYRTLLLNQTDQGNSNEYIASGFNAITLPTQLQQFYNLLFPTSISRYYAQFLVFCYLQILRAANQEQFVTSLDNRITYQLENINDYFLINQISVPVLSNFKFPISIFGQYQIDSNIAKNYEDILISQITGIYVSIYSKTKNLYYNQQTSSSNLTSDFIIKLSSNLMNTTSDTINVSTTGLSFVIAGSLVDISSASGLTWEFIGQAPFNFDFNAIFTSLLTNQVIVNNMLSFNPVANDSSSLNLWKLHYNPVYRFAGLLNCFVLQLNKLL